MSEPSRSPGEDFMPKPPSGDFHFLKIYTKDVSFETPNTPEVFALEWKPETDVNLRTNVKQLGKSEYEVTLSITATATVGEDRTAFVAEVQQAGIFKIVGLTSEELAPVVGAYCPAMLYPYAREVVSHLVSRGGFPPFILAPVNFDALYANRKQEMDERLSGAVEPTQTPS